MLIKPINYNIYNKNTSTQSSPTKKTNNLVAFTGIKYPLHSIKIENFQSESAKKLFYKIHKYFQLIQNGGNINDVKLFREELAYYDSRMGKYINQVDTLISIERDSNRGILRIYRQFPNGNRQCVLDANLDKHGQMLSGQYLLANLRFERSSDNIRRMTHYNNIVMPHGYNDREWGFTSDILPDFQQSKETSTRGLLEVFIELARLRTTLYK